MARNSHALSTKYNIDYNGQIALNKGVESVKNNYKDNFWKQLPIERMQITDNFSTEKASKNTDFELAEDKATKAIQKHSMNIGGQEKNYQIDESYFLLGKARYFDQRFIPALDAFNYILYKYPTSSVINDAKIWREKTNMRLGNDAQVIKNISKLLEQKKLENQVIANANALLAESFLNLEEKDSAIAKLKIAKNHTKINTEKARYRFILGQLYQELGKKDSAILSYQSVIDMNRKAEREYVIQAYAKKAELFDYETGNEDAFVKSFDKLIADRENRQFLDLIHYEMGSFYDKKNNQELAKKHYNTSLKSKSKDPYLVASNYRNLGNMSFKNTDYLTAAKYYDSTLVDLDVKTREYIHIKKVRTDLDEVIEFESIAKKNDSILNVVSMSGPERINYFEEYIEKLKKTDENKKILEEKQKIALENGKTNTAITSGELNAGGKPLVTLPLTTEASSKEPENVFYFYNPTTVAFGATEFKKKWGTRALGGYWRLPSNTTSSTVENDETIGTTPTSEEKLAEVENPQYSTAFYLDQLPKTQLEIDKISKERNSAYYQLGIIYKEKFKEYELASQKLEKLLQQNPEEKLVLPTMYNLYKIYQITDNPKAEEMKNRITSQYPNSRYSEIINNKISDSVSETGTPENEYEKCYKLYLEEQFISVLDKADGLITRYYGDEIVPKFELLKANTIGKLKGLEAYKKSMQFIADNYPNSEEGRYAQEVLTNQIPSLEKMDFSATDAKNWKILYKVANREDKNTKSLEERISKFIKSENIEKLSYSYDTYNEKENFITIQGMKSEAYAKDIAALMKEDKKYKVTEPAIIISSENYKVVQIKKNLDKYLSTQKESSISNPNTANPKEAAGTKKPVETSSDGIKKQ